MKRGALADRRGLGVGDRGAAQDDLEGAFESEAWWGHRLLQITIDNRRRVPETEMLTYRAHRLRDRAGGGGVTRKYVWFQLVIACATGRGARASVPLGSARSLRRREQGTGGGQPCSTASTAPACTTLPTATGSAEMTPSFGARIGCSIFIESRTISVVPAGTVSPSL